MEIINFTAMNEIEKYILSQPEQVREGLEKLRQIVKKIVPDAEEVISYQMPAFKYHGLLLCYAGWNNHIGLYPCNSKTIVKFKKKDFIEQNLPTLSLAAKEVKYFKIESKQDINASVISINILTDPSGAKIYIDGSLKGTEPTHKVVPGVHNIKIEMDGYTTLQKAIEVTEENNLFRFPLEKVEQVGIQIRSIPDKAQIYPPDTGDIWYCLGAVWHSRRRNMG